MKLYFFKNHFKINLLLFWLLTGLSFFGKGQAVINPVENADDVEIGVVEHLDDFLPDSISLINEEGKQVWLSDVIDKPTIINFVYYRCPGICSPLMEAVAGVMNKSEMVAGKDYQVLTISFDPSETIDLGIRKKESYLGLLSEEKAAEARDGWLFFVSDSASIVEATNATGFKYKKNGNDFLHAASLTVVSPEGKITRYLNGMFFLPFEWKMAIVEASKGLSGPTLNKVLRFCFTYDPVGQAYVLNFTKLGGIIIMFFAIVLLLYLVLKPKKNNISKLNEAKQA
jgi:protein SCO1/2